MLQEMLKLLFQTQQPSLLLEALTQPSRDETTPVNTVNKESYIYRASRRGTKGSLDQLAVQLDVVSDYYFFKPEDTCDLHFSESPSVLNMLLHFSKDKLIVDDGSLCCRYRTIDEWHDVTSRLGEDLFTTSYLAAYDLERGHQPRTRFLWDPYLNVETADINHLFTSSISEVHAHLKGSSANFELSWLSLMNYPSHREGDFLQLFDKKTFEGRSKKMRDLRELYLCVAYAAVIRLWLFASQRGLDENILESIAVSIKELDRDKSIEEISWTLSQLSAMAWNFRTNYGYSYDIKGIKGKIPDYAIKEGSSELISVLSGERSILYHAFRKAFDGDEVVSLYLYSYIIFKQQLREKIIQLNDVVGFGNFDNYERQKSRFIPEGSVYERLLIPMAFLFFLGQKESNRYMEGRVVPKTSVGKNSEAVIKMDRYVKAWLSEGKGNDNGDEKGKDTDKTFNGYYIYHFIKEADVAPAAFSPRHYKLRRKIKQQAVALYEFRNKGYKSASRVVGIDAANSEIKCRPEVFAQAFRFLRRHDIIEEVENHPSSLGFTYHVGEDFYDVVDGLRAVDEVLTYMNFRSNDRLGHALVLGTDVRRYYASRDKTVRATRHVLLDNMVWLYVRIAKLEGRTALCEYLVREAKRLFELIYTETDKELHFDVYDYYDSWLLRGDAPETAISESDANQRNIGRWSQCSENTADADANRARKNKKARQLYYEYHFNKKAKENGNKAIVFPIAHNYYEEFVEMVDKVREMLLCKVERLHIAIECNPSSNLRIGEMTDYIEHPIFRFNNYGLKTPYPPHEISVSINTDDSGVFATSLEREYALMGIALEKTDDSRFKNSPRAVKEWLNRVRKMSVEQRFVKDI